MKIEHGNLEVANFSLLIFTVVFQYVFSLLTSFYSVLFTRLRSWQKFTNVCVQFMVLTQQINLKKAKSLLRNDNSYEGLDLSSLQCSVFLGQWTIVFARAFLHSNSSRRVLLDFLLVITFKMWSNEVLNMGKTTVLEVETSLSAIAI